MGGLKNPYNMMHMKNIFLKKISKASQPAFTCSKLTIETLEQGVKHVQSYQ